MSSSTKNGKPVRIKDQTIAHEIPMTTAQLVRKRNQTYRINLETLFDQIDCSNCGRSYQGVRTDMLFCVLGNNRKTNNAKIVNRLCVCDIHIPKGSHANAETQVGSQR